MAKVYKITYYDVLIEIDQFTFEITFVQIDTKKNKNKKFRTLLEQKWFHKKIDRFNLVRHNLYFCELL